MKKTKKVRFFLFKKKWIIFTLLCAIIISVFACLPKVINSSTPKAKYTIAIDAGHGGIDGGAVGKTSGVTESVLNLSYANCLKEYLQDFGFSVVMTRTTENGLYSPIAKNKKKDDMQKRKEIIENSEKQRNIAMGLQEERNTEYKTAEAQGVFNA